MATNSIGNNMTKTISMEVEMGVASEARRIALGFRSYSSYIQNLLRKDLAERKDIVMSETKPVPAKKRKK